MIALLCPTRQRPVQFARMVTSAVMMADHPEHLEVVAYVDDDDDTYDGTEFPECVRFIRGPRITLSEMWNRCHAEASDVADIFGHLGDDIIFRTPGWDVAVCEAFESYPDRIAFVHGRDGYHDARMGTHGFLSREWIDAVGYFVPPHFSSDYNDTWLNEVADRIGRRVFLPDVLTEHMHYLFGKAEIDQNTRDRLERHQRDGVADLYAALAPHRAADADKLRAVMS